MLCRDDLLNFGKCRVVDLATPVPCENTPRCGNPLVKNKKFCFYHQCDYAVLIGGAWNSQTSHPRYKKNLKLFWNFLHKENNFSAEHITTFYSHDGAIERKYKCKYFCSVFFNNSLIEAARGLVKVLIHIKSGIFCQRYFNECSMRIISTRLFFKFLISLFFRHFSY